METICMKLKLNYLLLSVSFFRYLRKQGKLSLSHNRKTLIIWIVPLRGLLYSSFLSFFHNIHRSLTYLTYLLFPFPLTSSCSFSLMRWSPCISNSTMRDFSWLMRRWLASASSAPPQDEESGSWEVTLESFMMVTWRCSFSVRRKG